VIFNMTVTGVHPGVWNQGAPALSGGLPSTGEKCKTTANAVTADDYALTPPAVLNRRDN